MLSVRDNKRRGCALLRSLYDREINGTKTRLNVVKATYQTVYPNCSVINVKTPTPYVRKFSPDGRYLIAFSNDLTSVEVYVYRGCSMAVDLLKKYEEDHIEELMEDYEENTARCDVFNTIFRLKHSIKVTPVNEKLIRTCSLFTKNGDHILVGSSCIRLTNNEDIAGHFEFLDRDLLPLEDYTLHLVDLNFGSVSDTISFKLDKIYFNYNFGIYLLNDTLAVLSIYYQTIRMYKIVNNCFCPLRTIRQFCDDSINLDIENTPFHTFMNNITHISDLVNSTSGLQLKMLVFLLKKVEFETKSEIQSGMYNSSYYFEFGTAYKICGLLRMWRLQLLDENHLFIRYASQSVAAIKVNNPSVETFSENFMVYNITTGTVLNFFENTSDELLNMYESFCDNFRNPSIYPLGVIPPSISNNEYSRQLYRSYKSTIYTINGEINGNQKILGQLPVEAQLCSTSPYLDPSLFSYDDIRISPVQAPRIAMKRPIKFFSKESGLPSFSLHTGRGSWIRIMDPRIRFYCRRMVEFIFHPTEPFALSIVRDRSNFILNIHTRQVYMPEK